MHSTGYGILPAHDRLEYPLFRQRQHPTHQVDSLPTRGDPALARRRQVLAGRSIVGCPNPHRRCCLRELKGVLGSRLRLLGIAPIGRIEDLARSLFGRK